MGEYQRTEIVDAPADGVFAWVSDANNLPKYLPPIKDADLEGPSAPGTPGDRVKLDVEIPGRGEFESEGYLSVDKEARSMEWGAEAGRDYSGRLTVSDRADGRSEVTVRLSFGERSVEDEIQEESSDERDPLEESLDATLESIRRQIEEGAGKLPPTSPTD